MLIEKKVSGLQERLTSHSIYSDIRTLDELRIFMSAHVFAVWDFMSLAKRLQNELSCTKLPWMPSKNTSAARLINEIIFYEETDLDYNEKPTSHLEMYLSAMDEIGADSTLFKNFIGYFNSGIKLPQALAQAKVPDYIADFVIGNITCAISGQKEEVASNFLFGREDAIPSMFTLFLEKWAIDKSKIPALAYYLERHIDLDGDEHGPAAHKILSELIADDQEKENRAIQAAISAIGSRIDFWDGIVNTIYLFRATTKTRVSA